MYIACLCPNLVSVHFYAIPIFHFKFPKFFIYLFARSNPVVMHVCFSSSVPGKGWGSKYKGYVRMKHAVKQIHKNIIECCRDENAKSNQQ